MNNSNVPFLCLCLSDGVTPVRMTVKRWLIVVAAMGFICAIESDRSHHRRQLILRQQAKLYRRKAIDYENDRQRNRLEMMLMLDAARIRARQRASADELEALERKEQTLQRMIDFCRKMKRKYELAAADPSLPVPPDPPPPGPE